MVMSSMIPQPPGDPDLLIASEILHLRWATHIIALLAKGEKRPKEIADTLGISTVSTLYWALNRLLKNHIIEKRELRTFNRLYTYYRLTARGREFSHIVDQIKTWGRTYR